MKTMFALAVALAAASHSFAAEGRVADEALAAMGLVGLETLSDSEGHVIRGQGSSFYFASANTLSAAAVPGAFNISQGTAFNPSVSNTNSNSFAAGFYNPYFLPPMTSQAGARGFAFGAR